MACEGNFNHDNTDFPSNKIWQIDAPFKHRMLVWNMARSILPTAAALNRFIPSLSPFCTQCLNYHETHMHVFRDCSKARVMWNRIFQEICKEQMDFHSFFNSDWDDWMRFNFKQGDKWRMVFAITVWHIWRNRNFLVFDLANTHPRVAWKRLQADIGYTNEAFQVNDTMVMASEPQIVWAPPPPRCFKLNTDGAWNKVTVTAAGVCVVRDELGRWVMGFSCKFRAASALAAEFLALRQGLKHCREHGFDNLIVEIDAKS